MFNLFSAVSGEPIPLKSVPTFNFIALECLVSSSCFI